MNDGDSSVVCGNCSADAAASDDFCPACGSLLVENITCAQHGDRTAEAACIICAMPFCAECGSWVRGQFLCTAHRGVEIIEGTVRIYGASDATQARFVAGCLGQEGLHPVVFERRTSPISMGGPDYTLFRSGGLPAGQIVNEIKIMVPCREVPHAERLLKKLEEAAK